MRSTSEPIHNESDTLGAAMIDSREIGSSPRGPKPARSVDYGDVAPSRRASAGDRRCTSAVQSPRKPWLPRLLLCFAVLGTPAAFCAPGMTGPAGMLSGDTLEIGGERVRLHGVDAPGLAQRCRRDAGIEWRCGFLARTELVRHINDRPVACEDEGQDAFGQRLATCRVEASSLGARLVERGWALAADATYAETEAVAREAGRGLWHDGFEPSADWRLEAEFPYRAEDENALSACACTDRRKSMLRNRQP